MFEHADNPSGPYEPVRDGFLLKRYVRVAKPSTLEHYHVNLGSVVHSFDAVMPLPPDVQRMLEEERLEDRRRLALRAWAMTMPAPWWDGEHTIAGLQP